jgi:hypothetical protein
MPTVRRALAGVVLLGLVGLGCPACGGARGWRTVSIAHADYQYPTRRLALSVESCRADVEAEAVETTEEEVRVTVIATGGGPSQEACADTLVLRLAQRLDGRRVVDGATGRRVPVLVRG